MLELYRITHRWIQQLEMMISTLQSRYPQAWKLEEQTASQEISDEFDDPFAW